jgi:hypothetical protein
MGKIAIQETGQPFHGLFMIISAAFFVFAFVMRFCYARGYGGYYSNRRDDDNLITDPSNFWHPQNIWHRRNQD